MLLLTSTFRMAARMIAAVEPRPRGKTVAFIAAAGAVEPWGGVHAAINRHMLRRLGFVVDELDLLRQPPSRIMRALREDDVIFVGGGNTFFLMRWLRRTGAAAAIVDEVRHGKPYVGESAGAVAAAPDIAYIGLMDRRDDRKRDDRGCDDRRGGRRRSRRWRRGVRRVDAQQGKEEDAARHDVETPCPGLGLTDRFVVPHVRGPLLGRAAAAIMARYGTTLPLAPITDRQALLVTDDGTRLIGPSSRPRR